MALINILAKSTESINWDDFLNSYKKLKTKNIEIFPVPKELGFDNDCLGIAVSQGYINKKDVVNELKLVIDLCLRFDFKMSELYNHLEITSDNINSISTDLLI